MASKSYTVARGQIEKGNEVVAKAGDKYQPKNKAEADRLIAAGVLIDPDEKKGTTPAPEPSTPRNPPNPSPGDGEGAGGGEGGGLDLGGGNAGQS